MIVLLGIITLCSIIGLQIDGCIPPQPPIREMDLLLTWYDPALGGISCDDDCTNLSLVPMTDFLYGRAAACPAELVGLDYTAVIYHPAIGERYCLDRGTAVIVEYGLFGGRWQWVIRLDLLESSPHPLNWHLLSGWDYEWVQVAGVREIIQQVNEVN
jgi:hypothetical protein